jgi:hypothetical protein
MTTPTPRTCTCPAGESPEPCEMKYALTECRISRLERELAAAQERAQAAEARAEANEKKIAAIVGWLEREQPDVFKRGLWDAIAEGKK